MICTICQNAIYSDTIQCAYCGTWTVDLADLPRRAFAASSDRAYRQVSFAPSEPARTAPAPRDSIDTSFIADDDREMTRLSTRRSSTPFWALDLPDDTCEVIVGAVVVGRAPSMAPQWLPGRALRVADASGSLSKSHVLFKEHEGAVIIRDLFSINGVIISQPGRPDLDLSPGASVVVAEDATIELGDVFVGLRRH